jgi:hypothetical protein
VNLFIFVSPAKTLVDRLFLIHIQLLGHFCHLTESKCAFFMCEQWIVVCGILRRKEINFTASLHKSADDYLTLTLKVLCSAFLTFTRKCFKKKNFFPSPLFFRLPSRRYWRQYATEQKIFYIKFKFIVWRWGNLSFLPVLRMLLFVFWARGVNISQNTDFELL